MQALTGSTTSAFMQAARNSLIYIGCRFGLRILMKIWSQVFGGNQGGDIIRLRQQQIKVSKEKLTECNELISEPGRDAQALQARQQSLKERYDKLTDPGFNSRFQDASKLTSNVWYFVQTCVSIIAMVAA